MSTPFLTSQWRNLAMLNYEIDPAVLKPFVPRRAIAVVANTLYNERYLALPMRHDINLESNIGHAEYSWRFQKSWNHLRVETDGEWQELQADFARRIHHRTLLGLRRAARWRLPRISRRAPALACKVGDASAFRRRCARIVWK